MKRLGIVLLQSLPSTIDNVEKLKNEIFEKYPEEVIGIHEFHLWSLMHGQVVANLHVSYRDTEVCLCLGFHRVYTLMIPRES